MSLILQALKKAEAERSVGRVPTLDQVTAADPPSSAAPRRAAWAAAAVGLGVVGIGAAAWFWTTTGRVAPPAVAPAAVPAAAPPAPVAALPAASPPVAESAPAPRASAAASATTATPAPAPSASAAVAIAALPPSRPASTPARPASAAEAPMPALHDLPVAVRQSLPPLPLGGSIWSPNPAERMLILGGEVRREGDAITPELVLISIGPRSAVLRWREQSFRLPY